jgi:RHH-type rel operon transcriptional repressor/antitoxin RelB
MYYMLSIRLSKNTEERLERVARKSGRTKSFYIRQAIEEKIEEMEDLAIAIERLEHPGKTQTLAEVAKELNIPLSR